MLEHDVPAAATAPILRRHVVLVFVDRLDMASARAIQYARTLTPDEMRAVHFALDEDRAQRAPGRVAAAPGCSGSPSRSSSARTVASPGPRWSAWPASWATARPRSASCSRTASTRASGTASCTTRRPTPSSRRCRACPTPTSPPCRSTSTRSTRPRCRCRARSRGGAARLAGRKGDVPPRRPRPPTATAAAVGVPGCTVDRRGAVAPAGHASPDGSGRCGSPRSTTRPRSSWCWSTSTGGISVVFLGRRGIAGVDVGTRLLVEGTVGVHKARLAPAEPDVPILA